MANPILSKMVQTLVVGVAGVAGQALFPAGAEKTMQSYKEAKDEPVTDPEVKSEPVKETKTETTKKK